MIYPAFFKQAQQAAEVVANDQLLADDLWRVRNAWFGPRQRPQGSKPVMLLLGARSGVEAALAVLADPMVSLHVVEPHLLMRERLMATVADKAKVYPSLTAALASGLPERIGHVRVDQSQFDATTIAALLRSRSVEYLCGEMDPTRDDPMPLYRLLQDKTSSFYVRWGSGDKALASRGSRPEIEVSVVIPAYGVEAYLDICLESVVSQTLERLEVIVVDDGSLDRSGAIADVWAARYPNRIKVIHKPNGGCASARMAGLYAAEGLYVGFVDGDDWVAPTMYEELYRGAATEAAEISQCGFYEAFNDGTKVMHPTAFAGAGLGGTTGVVRKPEELLGLQPSVWRRIFRRDFLLTRRIEFPSHIKRFDDLPFAFLSLAQAQRVAIIPDCFYAYRQGRLGQDIESRDERLYIHFDIFDWLYKRIMPWATQSILQQFNQVEFGTHMWALDRIERRLVPEYRNRAIAQMKQHAAPAKMMMKLQKSRSKA